MESSKTDDLLHVAKAYLGTSLSENVIQKWQIAKGVTKEISTARRKRNEAKAKVLQRTPYPIVVNRMRFLIEKLQETRTAPTSIIHTGDATCWQQTTHRTKDLQISSTLATNTTEQQLKQTWSPRSAKAETVVSSNHHPQSVSEPLSSSRASLQSRIDELLLSLKHVSKFLRHVPDEHIRELCSVIKHESIKREETLFHIGDAADKFYMILTGVVEVTQRMTTNDNKEKFVIANLKKGQAFGDTAILNNKPRNATCVAVSNCTLLTVEKDEFLAILGPYFFGQKREIVSFLRNNVSIFANVSRDVCLSLMAFMMKLEYPEDTEWDVYNERHLYFIRRGSCALYSAETQNEKSLTKPGRRFPSTRSYDSYLDEVEIVDGKAIGTLGQESTGRSRKKARLQKELTTLTTGDWFGGGCSLIGEGEVQRQLRVYSKTDIEAFVIPVDDFLTYTDPEIIRLLREDACFRMTYYIGRKGHVSSTDFIGHHSINNTPVSAPRTDLISQKRTERVERQLTQERNDACGAFSPQVETILEHLRQTNEANNREIRDARYDCGTPTERFWSNPSLTRGVAHRRLDLLLEGIYTRGYTPLSEKLDRLIDRKAHKRNAQNANSSDAVDRVGVRKTDLVAASVLWERRRPPTAGIRQCLTYAEVIRNKRVLFDSMI